MTFKKKLGSIQIELTSDEHEALKHILGKHKGDYKRFADELYNLLK